MINQPRLDHLSVSEHWCLEGAIRRTEYARLNNSANKERIYPFRAVLSKIIERSLITQDPSSRRSRLYIQQKIKPLINIKLS